MKLDVDHSIYRLTNSSTSEQTLKTLSLPFWMSATNLRTSSTLDSSFVSKRNKLDSRDLMWSKTIFGCFGQEIYSTKTQYDVRQKIRISVKLELGLYEHFDWKTIVFCMKVENHEYFGRTFVIIIDIWCNFENWNV